MTEASIDHGLEPELPGTKFCPLHRPIHSHRNMIQTVQRYNTGRNLTMNIAIDIPDDIGHVLAAQAGGVSRAVLEAVAIESYRSGTITPAQFQRMLGLN